MIILRIVLSSLISFS
ncbi:hypothetical protein [Nitrosomonas nitrosa]